MDQLCFKRNIPVKYQTEICIVGGGPSGIAAAVSAARMGREVIVAESQGCFGGAATNALVPAFMSFDNGVDFLAGGIGREVYDKCIQKGGICENGCALGIHPEKLKQIYDEMMISSGAKLSLFTQLIDVFTENGYISHAVFASKSGIFAIEAKLFIDATGDGDLCALAGAKFEMGDAEGITMAASLCSIWYNIDWNKVADEQQNRMMDQAFKDHVFSQKDRHLPGMWKMAETLGGGNIGHCFGVDATDETSLTDAMLHGRQLLEEYKVYYNRYLDEGFRDADYIVTGACLGVRESRRIIGDYILTADDYNTRANFPDEIGRFAYPIDVHAKSASEEDYKDYHSKITNSAYAAGESYGIPMRVLLPVGLENVYVAGRCISADRLMQSSIRTMPSCFITGQACGVSAALAVSDDTLPRDVSISAIQKSLKGMGAFLPNYQGL